jgi:hypothetical protein
LIFKKTFIFNGAHKKRNHKRESISKDVLYQWNKMGLKNCLKRLKVVLFFALIIEIFLH